ncbi:Pyruvate synthase subunit porC [Desulfurococcus amylolyticus 1221n]|uniref:pyruvate synthase n=1 Tax=Desulfurococcus amylolyticus (strain DSM 18924 / JCM 16383 / VKM B-2413 / 1221n) TaxID=490899 RepID=B8D476_DESA1|nr:2-oxoacid:acceptor oxidoreductase family protein [Desulfurococcus amylolyticus]ACL10907.1 Pyruvate synthase subunit porC [Desulfurococcus amylolyticus 1221n]
MMIEIRWHGRGGQGAWTASNIVAMAAALEGRHAQSFPAFGPERSGAPMLSFTRISDEPIEIHSMIYEPDIAVVLDYTLLSPGLVSGLKRSGTIITNYAGSIDQVIGKLGIKKGDYRLILVPASKLALEILRANITNTAMIGGLLKHGGVVGWDSVEKAVKARFKGPVAEKNLALIKKAYEESIEV